MDDRQNRYPGEQQTFGRPSQPRQSQPPPSGQPPQRPVSRGFSPTGFQNNSGTPPREQPPSGVQWQERRPPSQGNPPPGGGQPTGGYQSFGGRPAGSGAGQPTGGARQPLSDGTSQPLSGARQPSSGGRQPQGFQFHPTGGGQQTNLPPTGGRSQQASSVFLDRQAETTAEELFASSEFSRSELPRRETSVPITPAASAPRVGGGGSVGRRSTGGGGTGGGGTGGTGGGGTGGGGRPPRDAQSRFRDDEERRRRRRRGRVGRFFLALGITGIAVACAVLLAVVSLQTASDMLGMNKEDVKVEFTVPENATLDGVVESLHKAGIIKQPFMYKVYLKFSMDKEEETVPFVAGTYQLNTKMAYNQITDKMSRGIVEKETVTITFPEGQTLRQIAEKLEEGRVCSAQEFIDQCNTGRYGYTFEDKIPTDPLRYHRLEGYIFPDTYEFYVDEKIDSVVNKFLNIFNTRVTQDLYDLMEKRGMTLDETLTLASVIQKEAGDAENMYLVSSVFHNRLKSAQFPRLESDATLLYAEQEIKPYLTPENQPMLDAYNTYIREGLPIGPINNPSLDAIKMALDPAETSYYYFLSDQKGEYHYSATLAEHNRFLVNAGEAHGTTITHTP